MLISESQLRALVRSVLLENNEVPKDEEEFGDEGEFSGEGLLKSLKPWSFNLLKLITSTFDKKYEVNHEKNFIPTHTAEVLKIYKEKISRILKSWVEYQGRHGTSHKFTVAQKKELWGKLIKQIEYYYKVKNYSVNQISEMLLPKNHLWLDLIFYCYSSNSHIGVDIWGIFKWLQKHEYDMKHPTSFSDD